MVRNPTGYRLFTLMSSDLPLPKMHHTGFVVASIADVIEAFCRSVRGSGWSQIWHDPIQRVRVAFIYPASPGDSEIELVEPAGDKAPVRQFLERGGGLHHVCYEVDDIAAELAAATARGLTIIRRPQPAVALDGRLIAWVMTKEKLLIEYLERGRSSVPERE